MRRPLLMAGILACAMLLLLSYSDHQSIRARLAMQAQQSRQARAQENLQGSADERNLIFQYLPLYLKLLDRGFIGEERRIDWIDALRNINAQHKLFGINYHIGAQELCNLPFKLATGRFLLHCSSMKIEMPLLHEGDLLTLIGALDNDQLAPFMLRDCVMARTNVAAIDRLEPSLNVSCELDWLTATEPVRGKS